MSLSYEEAIGTLKSMFPEWDDETLGTLLMANNYHVERTIETILSMSGDTSIAQEQEQEQANANNLIDTEDVHIHTTQTRNEQPVPASNRRNRGRGCSLPDDFLRPPGYQFRMIGDEELALMLQNELFRNEARQILGEDFIQTSQRRPSQAASTGRNTRPTNTSSTASDGDLGIMKSLSSLGSAARKNLNQLAVRFSQNNNSNTNRNSSRDGNYNRQSESGNVREFKPLVDSAHDDEDTEVISFDNKNASRSKHVLQDDLDVDSENPLIQQQSYATNNQQIKK